MPLFQFDSRAGDLRPENAEGEEFPDVNAAREAADASARQAVIEKLDRTIDLSTAFK